MINKLPLMNEGFKTFAFSSDRKLFFVCPNNASEILVYDTLLNMDITKWKLVQVLEEHTQMVSGLDFNVVSNQLVSCSHDKNVLVWNFFEDKWKPSLVIIPQQSRAALCVKWNKKGNKFAMGSGNKKIYIGYFEPSNNWWTCISMKVHNSSVVAVDFHPNGNILASCGTDRKIVISECFVKVTDPAQTEQPIVEGYGKVLYSIDCASWVNDISFSPSGQFVFAASHNSCLHFVNLKKFPEVSCQTIQSKSHPMMKVLLTSDTTAFAGGFDQAPVFFTADKPDEFTEKCTMEQVGSMVKKISSYDTTKNIFAAATLGQGDIDFLPIMQTKHKNVICGVQIWQPGVLMTCDVSGYIQFWAIK